MTTTLLIIDPQNDFCDIPSELSMGNTPTLPVPGSHQDMVRLSSYIRSNTKQVQNIVVTLDSHNLIDIAHHLWWINKNGDHPAPFTTISLEDIEQEVWLPANIENLLYAKFYVSELKKENKYNLIIWPDHCIVGTWGHNVHSELSNALKEWTKRTGKNVEYVFKGLNPLTEHYSAIKAEVQLDSHTQRNDKLLDSLAEANEVLVAGEAFSHCVSSTVFDIKDYFDEMNVETTLKIFENCTSPVYGFEEISKDIKEKMIEKGIKFISI